MRYADCNMVQQVEAIYENGSLRLLEPLHLKDGRVVLSVSHEATGPFDALLDHDFVRYAKAEVARMATHSLAGGGAAGTRYD